MNIDTENNIWNVIEYNHGNSKQFFKLKSETFNKWLTIMNSIHKEETQYIFLNYIQFF